jgi:hypothetical protein
MGEENLQAQSKIIQLFFGGASQWLQTVPSVQPVTVLAYRFVSPNPKHMNNIFERVERMLVGTKLFFVGLGLILLMSYNHQAQPPSQFYRSQTSASPPVVQRRDQQSSPPTEIATPTPVAAETPYSASSSPTVKVRRALPPDSPSPKWPDGRILGHPRDVVQSHVINVPRGEPLEMRGGPGDELHSHS